MGAFLRVSIIRIIFFFLEGGADIGVPIFWEATKAPPF